MVTTLHTPFATRYTELALAMNEIAERIRALGARAPGSDRQLPRLSAVKEAEGTPPPADMVRTLVADQAVVGTLARAVVEAATAAHDDASADLGIRRQQVHEKNAWMLRSHLE